MDFITIDFETATPQRNSACEIGLTFVEAGTITDTKSWLIQPPDNEYNPFNIRIHGIKPEETINAPEFDELWEEIQPLIDGKLLIAHNASFDMSVLRNSLDHYDLSFPRLDYLCSYIFSKNVWKGLPAYDLATLCYYNDITFQHHRAGSDSRATAELSLKAFEASEVLSVADFPTKLQTSIGILFDGGYRPSSGRRKSTYRKPKEIIADPEKQNPDSIFFGRNVVFTGTLSSMPRTVARQTIADIGGFVKERVTRQTDFLVVGHQEYKVVGQDGISRKQRYAMELVEKGFELEILSESDFIKNL